VARPQTYVALLRAINVGGKSLVPMAKLRDELASLGLTDVVTYIQSGNAVFESLADDADALAPRIEERLSDAFGAKIAVLLRTPQELERVTGANPFLARGADVSKLHVVFLDRAPDAAAAAELDPDRSPPDELALRGRELYLHLPNGAGRTKLTLDYLERVLGVRGTQRSWRTVLTLVELSRGRAGRPR